MYQAKTVFSKTTRGKAAGENGGRCRSCGAELYVHRG